MFVLGRWEGEDERWVSENSSQPDASCLLLSVDRTLIAHTKALDPSRPVTFVTNCNYDVDQGVSLGVPTQFSPPPSLVLPYCLLQ